MQATYKIYQPHMDYLRGKIDALNRRCAKLGVAPIVLRETGEVIEVPVKNNDTGIVIGFKRYITCEVTGESPKFAGWELAAVVEHAEEGNILRKSPGCKVELAAYRTCGPRCDHCQTARNRRETFIVLHDDGTLKLIGRNCIKDFLGHKDPHQLATLAEIDYTLGEICSGCEDSDFFGGGSPVRDLLSVGTFLNYVALAVRKFGYVTSKRAKDDVTGGTTSTAAQAISWMFPSRERAEKCPRPEACDEARATTAREYVLAVLGAKAPEALSDFEHNLFTAAKCEGVERKNSGVLAYLVEYYSRAVETAKTAAESTYFGELKKRYKGQTVTYLKSTGFDSAYGYTFIHSFAGPNNSRLMWKTGSGLNLDAGSEVQATFTVKAHEDYKGHKQTKITRFEIVEKVAPAPINDQWGHPLAA